MTKRAFFIILVFVSLLTTLGYLNDHVLRLESTSNGHQLPIIVIGSLFLFVLTINPLLGRFWPKKMFLSTELAVIVAICSCACGMRCRIFGWSRIQAGKSATTLINFQQVHWSNRSRMMK